jgi:hypothetical protein
VSLSTTEGVCEARRQIPASDRSWPYPLARTRWVGHPYSRRHGWRMLPKGRATPNRIQRWTYQKQSYANAAAPKRRCLAKAPTRMRCRDICQDLISAGKKAFGLSLSAQTVGIESSSLLRRQDLNSLPARVTSSRGRGTVCIRRACISRRSSESEVRIGGDQPLAFEIVAHARLLVACRVATQSPLSNCVPTSAAGSGG